MDALFADLPELDRQVQAMSRTASPAEVFKVLREAAKLAAPRGAVFTVRQGRLRGWSGFGYPSTVLKTQREWMGLPEAGGWVARVFEDRDQVLVSRKGAGDPNFGQSPAAEAVASAIRISGQPIALLVLERAQEEQPWHPEALGLLVTVAQLRLELDLAIRRLHESAPGGRPEEASTGEQATVLAGPAPAQPSPTPPDPGVEFASAVLSEPTALEPHAEPQRADPVVDAARRYAKLVATDIRLYNEEAVALGRRNGDLVRRLEEHLGRGKETFLRRHGDLGPTGLELLHEAYVQVLAGGDAKLIPPTLFG